MQIHLKFTLPLWKIIATFSTGGIQIFVGIAKHIIAEYNTTKANTLGSDPTIIKLGNTFFSW